MAKDDFADIQYSEALVTATARMFVDLMRDGDEEGARIAMDYMNAHVYGAGICATHDYCDANMVMAQAVEEALVEAGHAKGRAEAFSFAGVSADVTDEARERSDRVWAEAWEKGRAEGFSYLKGQVSPEDFQALAPSMMHLPRNVDHHKGYPAAPDNALADSARLQEFIDAVEREEVPKERLSGMAAAIRAGDDAQLAALLLDTLGEVEEPDPAWHSAG